MAKFISKDGSTQDVAVSLEMVREASNQGLSLREYVNRRYPTDAGKYGETFAQMCASENILFNPSKVHGIRAPKLDALFNPVEMQAGSVVGNSAQSNQARLLLMPAILALVEDKLLGNLEMNASAFDMMVALDDVVTSDWVLWPQANYSRPEGARSQRVSQLSKPATMLTLTTLEKSLRIPTFSLGIEWSDQAAKILGLDYISMSILRQALVEKNERANENLLAMLNGDQDTGQAALSAPIVATATSFDSSLNNVAGALSHKAWMKFLYRNSTRRTVTHVVTDINGALAIENRSGKPVINTDDPNSTRIDTLQSVMNPGWSPKVETFITDDPNWPANTIMGLDKRFGIHRVTSASASYQAQEDFALRRGSAMRFDTGSVARRFFDDAFDVLTLN